MALDRWSIQQSKPFSLPEQHSRADPSELAKAWRVTMDSYMYSLYAATLGKLAGEVLENLPIVVAVGSCQVDQLSYHRGPDLGL